ncbi:Phage antirepressor protein KilAC domain-containing protein [Actinopolyspora alba]|uniref:Phage antirepressor protein KilAC domain-containing protein n=1 Tax=Actinopolyspora alba TaxID=673379 RepID=A0A1I2BGG9_9ACTN|nr:phage antirepressor [Actinopolyspora alba]SFE55265.1 Phage antirepressor protein KilAC domain-containing protein [Actinopolyspora alba]
MTELVPFTYGHHQIRTLSRDGEPWFVATDGCRVLDIRNVAQAVGQLDDDEVSTTYVTDSSGRRQQETYIVNEPGLYSLILRSRKPEAREFKRWVTHSVLPQIRRTGRYELAEQPQVPQSYAAALRAHADAVEAAEAAEARAAGLEPDARSWQQLAEAHGDHSVREAAQALSRAGIRTGQNRLFASLRDMGWIDRSGRPYQSHVDAGRVTLRTTSYTHPHTGEPTLSAQVRITPTGLAALREELGEHQAALL